MTLASDKGGFNLGVIASFWNAEEESYNSNETGVEVAMIGDHAKDNCGDGLSAKRIQSRRRNRLSNLSAKIS